MLNLAGGLREITQITHWTQPRRIFSISGASYHARAEREVGSCRGGLRVSTEATTSPTEGVQPLCFRDDGPVQANQDRQR